MVRVSPNLEHLPTCLCTPLHVRPHVHICQFVCQSFSIQVHPFICRSVHQSGHICPFLSDNLCLTMFVRPSGYRSIRLYKCLSVSVYLSMQEYRYFGMQARGHISMYPSLYAKKRRRRDLNGSCGPMRFVFVGICLSLNAQVGATLPSVIPFVGVTSGL